MRRSSIDNLPKIVREIILIGIKLTYYIFFLEILFIAYKLMIFLNEKSETNEILKAIKSFFIEAFNILDYSIDRINTFIDKDPHGFFMNIVFIIIIYNFIKIIINVIKRIRYRIENKGKDRYWSEFPDELPPYAATWLLQIPKMSLGNIIAGEISMFIDEGYIKVRKVSGTYHYYFNKKIDEKEGFWKYQISLFNMLYYEIGQGTGELCLNDFNNFKYKSNKNISLRKLFFSLSLGLEDELLARGYRKEIVEKQWGILKKIMMFILISLKFIFIIELPIALVTLGEVNIFLVAFAYSLVLIGFFTGKKDERNLTEKGEKSYKDWCSFKRFITNYSKFKDRGMEDIIVWHKVIAYAVAFNLSDKLAEEVKESGIGELSRTLCNALLKESVKNLLNT